MTWPIAVCLTIGGVLVGRVWSDVANAYKYAHADHFEARQADARQHLLDAIPRWLLAFVIVTGLVTIIIGGAQVWQTYKFTDYQSCQATHDQHFDEVQTARAKANLELTKKRFEYDKTVLPLLKPGNDEKDLATTTKALQEYIDSAVKYFNTVEENPIPETTTALCGTPKG